MKKGIEDTVHYTLLVAIVGEGIMNGFGFAGVIGMLGILAFHYRHDFMPKIEPHETKSSEHLDTVIKDHVELKFRVEQLQEKMSQMNAMLAFRGLKPKQAEPTQK